MVLDCGGACCILAMFINIDFINMKARNIDNHIRPEVFSYFLFYLPKIFSALPDRYKDISLFEVYLLLYCDTLIRGGALYVTAYNIYHSHALDFTGHSSYAFIRKLFRKLEKKGYLIRDDRPRETHFFLTPKTDNLFRYLNRLGANMLKDKKVYRRHNTKPEYIRPEHRFKLDQAFKEYIKTLSEQSRQRHRAE
jgi:hypothetical protein